MPARRNKQYDLLRDRERMLQGLLQKLHQRTAVSELLLRVLIKIGRELGKHFHLTILREVDTDRTGCTLHRLCLRRTADTRYGKTYVDGRTASRTEQLALKENLTVCDGNNVGRNICGHVARLCLYDR